MAQQVRKEKPSFRPLRPLASPKRRPEPRVYIELKAQGWEERDRRRNGTHTAPYAGVDERGLTVEERRVWQSTLRGF
jgi:hypothetical protein